MTIHYDAKNRFSVMFRWNGSVWPRVLPYCLLNVTITIILYSIKQNGIWNPAINDAGHKYLTTLASFFVITRTKIIYDRFWMSRDLVALMFRSARRLASKTAVYTMCDSSEEAQQYREQIKKGLLKLVGSTTYIIQDNAMSIALVDGYETNDVTKRKYSSDNKRGNRSDLTKNKFKILLNPMILGLNLHADILTLSNSFKLIKQRELDLSAELDNFLMAYQKLTVNSSSPFPFPLTNMAYILIDVWLFTLPFALCNDIENMFVAACVIFLLTFGFTGLIWVATELQDPFNGDPNDFEMNRYRNRTARGIEADLSSVYTGRDKWHKMNDKVNDKETNEFKWESYFGQDMSYGT